MKEDNTIAVIIIMLIIAYYLGFNYGSIVKREQAEKFKKIENEYQINLTNKQQEVKILKEIIFEGFHESADLLKTLTEIMKFNEDDVPDNLLEKRQQFFQTNYNKKQALVVGDLRKLFDDIALTSNRQFSNRYFCNKKISHYDSTICASLSKDPDNYEINLSRRNLVVLPKDIFTGFENIENLDLSYNRLDYLEPGTFNNLLNLQTLALDVNNLRALSSDIFNGIEKLTSLSLSQNKLNFIQPGTFNNLSNLKCLYIYKNRLTSLPKDIFVGLKNLEMIGLSSNRLMYLDSDIFSNLPVLLYVDIQENNLTTDSINILKNMYYFGSLELWL
ncbi:leucine-rich repeat-containing protein 15-like [Aphidius gifuensis]|uniref:leucine-rich repeat-containing protein 15-like n=1 Tax=Aphidius gifuensis TaxID=684658 RepID=UPI001CDBECAD|nr:leucine-rich repeat-containing protein 15-like [Aphidius gifuensis]